MAYLDLTELMYDPDFCESFKLIRGVQTVDDHGIAQTSETIYNLYGSIQAGSPKDLLMQDDLQAASNQINIYCQFEFYDVYSGFAVDKIQWRNNQYKVKKTYSWQNWGQGWNVVVCELLPVTQAP